MVGRIRKPHGIKGEIAVSLETDRPAEVFRPERRLWLSDEAGQPNDPVVVERGRPFKGGFLVKLSEFDQRDDALEALRGRSLFMLLEEAEPVAEDEIPHHELIGMRVRAGERQVGEVEDIYELGWAEMLVVRKGDREVLIPLVREVVSAVDREEGVLELDPPAGLLDL